MNSKFVGSPTRLVIALSMIALSSCQSIQQSEQDARQMADQPLPQQALADLGYSAKPAVAEIVQWSGLYNWEPVDDYSLIIWPNAFSQYLLTMKYICPNIRYAQVIALSNTEGKILANFDSVMVGGGEGAGAQRCVIKKIYPLKKSTKNHQ